MHRGSVTPDPQTLAQRLSQVDLVVPEGHLLDVENLRLGAQLPEVSRGEWVRIERHRAPPLDAEVVGFDENRVWLIPFGDTRGTRPGDRVRSLGRPFSVPSSRALLGRVLDGLGRPMDGGPPLHGSDWPVHRPAPCPLQRPTIDIPLATGVRAIDGLCSLGYGQRMALMAPSGAGKSTLLAQLARQADVDVCVVALIGERGRELRAWLDALPTAVLKRCVFVCATSDTPALVRRHSAHVATSIGEYFRAQGERVLLLVDSLSRFVRASREVALAAGEPAVRGGYPASAFAELPGLLERAGTDSRGSLTAVYSVLLEADSLRDPIAEEVQGLLDGQWVLCRHLAEQGKFPAMDPVRSFSRLMEDLVDREHLQQARTVRHWIAHHDNKRELLELGAYAPGSDRLLEHILTRLPDLEALQRQQSSQCVPLHETRKLLARLVHRHSPSDL